MRSLGERYKLKLKELLSKSGTRKVSRGYEMRSIETG